MERAIYIYGFDSTLPQSQIKKWFGSDELDEIIWISGTSCVVILHRPELVKSFLRQHNKNITAPFLAKPVTENLLSPAKLKIIKARMESAKQEITPKIITQEQQTSLLNSVESCNRQYGREIINPDLQVVPITWNTKKFHVIRDDLLIGGTKQRALIPFLHEHPAQEFVYASPIYGYAQVALAYAARINNKRASVFVERRNPLHPLTETAKRLGAQIHQISELKLSKIQEAAEKYVLAQKNTVLLPFGLFAPEITWLLEHQIRAALSAYLTAHPPKRLWLVVGSGTILLSLARIWPKTHYLLVQVGKWINEEKLQELSYEVYIAPEQFYEKAKSLPPYPSVANYDAKLWQFAQRHGLDGDYIWNVGKDVDT